MFGFVQWDSPIALLIEVVLSLAIVAGLLWLARRVNAQSPPRATGGDNGSNTVPPDKGEKKEDGSL